MYAIIQTGGKQYRVKEGDIIDVELLENESGASFDFAEVLFVQTDDKAHMGAPHLANFIVTGEIIDTVKDDKITSVKYIPGNHYRKFGHRQKKSRVKITAIGEKKKRSSHGS